LSWAALRVAVEAATTSAIMAMIAMLTLARILIVTSSSVPAASRPPLGSSLVMRFVALPRGEPHESRAVGERIQAPPRRGGAP
jgi:hypothetical protein